MKRLGFMLVIATMAVPALASSTYDGSVDRIVFANRINGYTEIDDRHVVLNAGTRSYLLTLRNTCPTLNWGYRIGVSSTNNTIRPGFDYVKADGWRCSIERIDKVTREQIKMLRMHAS